MLVSRLRRDGLHLCERGFNVGARAQLAQHLAERELRAEVDARFLVDDADVALSQAVVGGGGDQPLGVGGEQLTDREHELLQRFEMKLAQMARVPREISEIQEVLVAFQLGAGRH